jgi:hypothetical protein
MATVTELNEALHRLCYRAAYRQGQSLVASSDGNNGAGGVDRDEVLQHFSGPAVEKLVAEYRRGLVEGWSDAPGDVQEQRERARRSQEYLDRNLPLPRISVEGLTDRDWR